MKSADTLNILQKIHYVLCLKVQITTKSYDIKAMNTNSVKVQSDKKETTSLRI